MIEIIMILWLIIGVMSIPFAHWKWNKDQEIKLSPIDMIGYNPAIIFPYIIFMLGGVISFIVILVNE